MRKHYCCKARGDRTDVRDDADDFFGLTVVGNSSDERWIDPGDYVNLWLVGGLDSGAVDAIADSISVFEARTGHGDLISLTWDKNPNWLDGQPVFEFSHWLHLSTLPCWSQRVTETKQKHISSGCIKLSMRDKFQEVHVWLSSAWNGWFAVDEETR